MNNFDWPDRVAAPLILPWPSKGNPFAVREFTRSCDWHAFIRRRDLDLAVPEMVRLKYGRAQRLYALAWFEFDTIKAGELIALTTLELALSDRYGGRLQQPKRKNPMLRGLLGYMVNKDGLADEVLPFSEGCGGSVLPLLYNPAASGNVYGASERLTLASMRNSMAHGDPFDGLPWGGLLDLVRDLIHYAYREVIALGPAIEATAAARQSPSSESPNVPTGLNF